MTTISPTAQGYGLANMLGYTPGSVAGAVPGTTSTATLKGAASLLQGVSGASTGMFGAISGTAAVNDTVSIFGALGETGTMQSAIASAKSDRGNSVDFAV